MDLLSDEEGGNLHILNGNVVKLADAGSAYTDNTKSENKEEDSDESTKEVLEVGKKQNTRRALKYKVLRAFFLFADTILILK